MNKITVSVLILTLLVVIGGSLFFGDNQQNNKQINNEPQEIENIEYYWREGCPYCDKVEDFLQDWDRKDEINIDKKDIGNDRKSANLMAQRARVCNIPQNQLGVPFMVTLDGECLIGDKPIIDYLTNLEI
jgi:glutaredoxin